MDRLKLHHQRFEAMGSPCEIQLYAPERQGRESAACVIAEVQRLERRYSRYRTDSFLAEINRVAAAGGTIRVDAETAGLLNYAATCHQQSDGLFDITSGVLRRVWRFERGVVPDPSEVEALLERVGWHRLRWRPPVLEFPVPGMELDLGGVVKEYAADRVAALCCGQGIRHGMVNLGGDIRIIGPRADGTPWRIGIRHPRSRNGILDTLALHEGAVASSGDYERCMLIDGVRYGHVLNPRSGWPVRRLAAVTVAGPLCVVAGSASTIAMLKEEQGADWLKALGLAHLWVDVDGGVGGTLSRPRPFS